MDNLTNVNVVKDILNRHGFSFSKVLGQNFLINPSVCPRIAEEGNARQGFGIIEIGTGIGTLTAELARRAEKVVAVEIDSRLLPIINETVSEFNNIKVINSDILDIDLHKLIESEFSGLKVAVCANLPYYITSPIIMHILESRANIESVTVMVQKEAADRLCAEVGTRASGAITVSVNYYGKAVRLFNVSCGSFMPVPNVDSSVIRIDIDKNNKLEKSTEELFFKIVKAGFSQRRKTLVNALYSGMGISKELSCIILEEIGLNRNIRAENLKMEEFKILCKKFKAALK